MSAGIIIAEMAVFAVIFVVPREGHAVSGTRIRPDTGSCGGTFDIFDIKIQFLS